MDGAPDVPLGSASASVATAGHEAEPITREQSSVAAVVPEGPAIADEAHAEASQTARAVASEASQAPAAHPAADADSDSLSAGPQTAASTSAIKEPAQSAEAALPDGAQASIPASGAPALASIRTSALPGSMARILLDSGSDLGQTGTPASHRISDVGSDEADEAVTPLASRLADASSASRPATPAAAQLTPR